MIVEPLSKFFAICSGAKVTAIRSLIFELPSKFFFGAKVIAVLIIQIFGEIVSSISLGIILNPLCYLLVSVLY